jgi:hypothetical protein
MREILFRGTRVDNGELAEGSLMVQENQHKGIDKIKYQILYPLPFKHMTNFDKYRDKKKDWKRDWTYAEVDPKTIGQYTGLKDVNDVRIFEGDLVKIYHNGVWSKDTSTVVFSYEYVGGWVAENDNQRLNIGTRHQHIKVVDK